MALYIGNGKKVSVRVVKDGGKVEGTAIPIGQVVEKIYFNINNTAEETLDVLKQLTYIQTSLVSFPINVIYANTADGITGSVIYAIKYSDTEIAIQELQNITSQKFTVLFNSENATLLNAGFNGWNFTHELGLNPTSTIRDEEFGISAMNIYAEGQALTDFNGIPIGLENEKIKNVLSITPFLSMPPYDYKISMGVTECQN